MSAPLQRFVNSFTVGLTLRMIYFSDHPSVRNAAQNVASALAELTEVAGAATVTVGHAKGRLVWEGRAVIALTPLARRLIEFMKLLGAGAFRFAAGTTVDELLALFTIYVENREKTTRDVARELLAARGVVHVELVPPLSSGGTGDPAVESTHGFGNEGGARAAGGDVETDGLVGDETPEVDVQAYHSLMAVVDTNHVQAARGATIDVAGAKARAEQIVTQDLQRLHDLMRLAHYPDFDAYTVGHSVRVALLATLVTESLGIAREKMIEIGAAALLHDVGKAQVPHEILYKPGPLTAEERRVMEGHPWQGGEILIESGEANPWSVCAAYGHHVRHDRRGYPKVPTWVRQTSATALIHVCDVFEALTAVRPYKPAFAPWRAYELMLQDHGAFDPAAMRAFVRAIGIFPPGSNVVLADGSEGIVVRAGVHPDRPVVQIRKRADDVALEVGAEEIVDLSDADHADVRVVRLLPPESVDPELAPEAADEQADRAAAPVEPSAEARQLAAPVSLDPCDPLGPAPT